MAALMDLEKFDLQVRFICRSHLRRVWEEDYGLSEDDVLSAASKASHIYVNNTDLPAIECSDRALDLAFEERDRLYDERI